MYLFEVTVLVAKYKAKLFIVDAEQYIGTDDSQEVILMLAGLSHSTGGWQIVGNELQLLVQGGLICIPRDTWLLKREDGQLEVHGPVIFAERYELTED